MQSDFQTRADKKQLCCRFQPVLAELRPALAAENSAKAYIADSETGTGRAQAGTTKKPPNSPAGLRGPNQPGAWVTPLTCHEAMGGMAGTSAGVRSRRLAPPASSTIAYSQPLWCSAVYCTPGTHGLTARGGTALAWPSTSVTCRRCGSGVGQVRAGQHLKASVSVSSTVRVESSRASPPPQAARG